MQPKTITELPPCFTADRKFLVLVFHFFHPNITASIGRENIKFIFVRENYFVAVLHWRTDIIICEL